MTHLFPKDDREHIAEAWCSCNPAMCGSICIHREFFDEDDLLKQAEAICDATSVELWAQAEREKLPVKIVPFKSLEPIQLPKSKNRK